MTAVVREIASIRQSLAHLTYRLAQLELQENAPVAPAPAAARARASRPAAGGTTKVIFDLETGGLGKTSEINICQVSCTAFDQNWNRLGRFTEFVNPLEPMDTSAINVHGFSDEFCSNFDDWSVIGRKFNDFLEEARTTCGAEKICLMAHNVREPPVGTVPI